MERVLQLFDSSRYKDIALVFASGHGHIEIVKFLVSKGVSHELSMSAASEQGHIDIVAYFLELGHKNYTDAIKYSKDPDITDLLNAASQGKQKL